MSAGLWDLGTCDECGDRGVPVRHVESSSYNANLCAKCKPVAKSGGSSRPLSAAESRALDRIRAAGGSVTYRWSGMFDKEGRKVAGLKITTLGKLAKLGYLTTTTAPVMRRASSRFKAHESSETTYTLA